MIRYLPSEERRKYSIQIRQMSTLFIAYRINLFQNIPFTAKLSNLTQM